MYTVQPKNYCPCSCNVCGNTVAAGICCQICVSSMFLITAFLRFHLPFHAAGGSKVYSIPLACIVFLCGDSIQALNWFSVAPL